MKKFVSILLACMLVLSLGVAAYAETTDYSNYQDKQPKVYKTYQVNNGTAPAETFTFKFEGQSYVNGDGQTVTDATIPAIANATISFNALTATSKGEATLGIDAKNYELGVYTYKVTEVAGDTAGVTYDDTKLYLVLTILRDENSGKHFVAAMHYETVTGEKKGEDGAIVNEYDAGSLSVTKNIAGNMANIDKEFAITVRFAAPTDKTVESTITVTKPDNTTETKKFTDGALSYTINLGEDDTVTFTNLPEGVTYTVTENAENYTSSLPTGGATGDIAANDTDSVKITNTLTSEVDTGVTLDSIPYIVMLVAAVAAIAVVLTRKKGEQY